MRVYYSNLYRWTSMQGNEYGQLMMSLVDDAYLCDVVIFY